MLNVCISQLTSHGVLTILATWTVSIFWVSTFFMLTITNSKCSDFIAAVWATRTCEECVSEDHSVARLAQSRSPTVLAPITLSLGSACKEWAFGHMLSCGAFTWLVMPTNNQRSDPTTCLRQLFVLLSLKHAHTCEDLTFFSVVLELPERVCFCSVVAGVIS